MTDVPRPQAEPKRGWRKLLLALVAFILLPFILRSVMPVDETMTLFVPAMAACALVGWWAGGRMFSALIWVGLAAYITSQDVASTGVFANMLRGWSLLLAGAFGVASIGGANRPFFTKAMIAVAVAMTVGLVVALVGPPAIADSTSVVATEFARRNAESMVDIKTIIAQSPALAELGANVEEMLSAFCARGR